MITHFVWQIASLQKGEGNALKLLAIGYAAQPVCCRLILVQKSCFASHACPLLAWWCKFNFFLLKANQNTSSGQKGLICKSAAVINHRFIVDSEHQLANNISKLWTVLQDTPTEREEEEMPANIALPEERSSQQEVEKNVAVAGLGFVEADTHRTVHRTGITQDTGCLGLMIIPIAHDMRSWVLYSGVGQWPRQAQGSSSVYTCKYKYLFAAE